MQRQQDKSFQVDYVYERSNSSVRRIYENITDSIVKAVITPFALGYEFISLFKTNTPGDHKSTHISKNKLEDIDK
jgi:hypothetical protein